MKKLLIFIIIFGAILRFTAINWDSFGAFHPDERNISWAVTRIRFFSQMNPKFFAYGGLPVYLYRALGEGVVAATHNDIWLADWGHIAVIGRSVSAVLSTISIFLIYVAGAAYFTPGVGLLAASLLAFSPWAIREAHFETTETMLVFFLLAMSIVARRLFQKPNRRSVVLIGLVWGLAMAAKTTSILFGLIPTAAIWFPHHIFKNIPKKILYTFMLGCTSVFIFFLFSPYTLLDFTHFRESMTYESGVALGRFSVVYTLQFLNTTPYLFQLQTMLWQAGPLGIIGMFGLIGLVIIVFRKKFYLVPLLLFPVLYFSWVGSWYAKFNRYNVPFLPFVTIAAAWFCVVISKRFRIAGTALTLLVLSATILWGLANWTVYLRPQTRLTASEWMFTHIPSGATIYTEHWNDGLPIDLPAQAGLPDAVRYNRELLTVYDEDNAAKKNYYADKLVTGDFIVLSTRRMWATMPRLGEKYPLTKLFYQRLLDGSLGYKEVGRFTSYPQLFGVSVNDDGAEESIQVFDHPTVLIFQNVAHYSNGEYLTLLTP